MSETITKADAAGFVFAEYRKVGTTKLSDEVLAAGTKVLTLEGEYTCAEPSRLAIDAAGNVYPVAESIFAKAYVPASPSPQPTPDLGTLRDAYVAAMRQVSSPNEGDDTEGIIDGISKGWPDPIRLAWEIACEYAAQTHGNYDATTLFRRGGESVARIIAALSAPPASLVAAHGQPATANASSAPAAESYRYQQEVAITPREGTPPERMVSWEVYRDTAPFGHIASFGTELEAMELTGLLNSLAAKAAPAAPAAPARVAGEVVEALVVAQRALKWGNDEMRGRAPQHWTEAIATVDAALALALALAAQTPAGTAGDKQENQ